MDSCGRVGSTNHRRRRRRRNTRGGASGASGTEDTDNSVSQPSDAMLNGVDEVLRENSGRGTGSGSSSTAGGPKMVNGKRDGKRVLIGGIFCLNFCANFYVCTA